MRPEDSRKKHHPELLAVDAGAYQKENGRPNDGVGRVSEGLLTEHRRGKRATANLSGTWTDA